MEDKSIEIQEIPCRLWNAVEPKGCIVMVHGLQSHSGWFASSATELASVGYTCIAYDRRGSGRSTLPRGHVTSYRQWFDELLRVLEHVESNYPSTPIHLLSLCFGAKVILGGLAEVKGLSERIRSLILQCPGIGTKVDLEFADKFKVAFTSKKYTSSRIPTPLSDKYFTDVPRYLEFMRDDPLALREATAGFYFETAKLNRRLSSYAEKISIPVLFMLAGQDRISDNFKSIRFFQNIPTTEKKMVAYSDVKHSLFFSNERERTLADIKAWLEAHS